MSTGIRRVQAAMVVLLLAILGFFGTHPALATETDPAPGTEQPGPGDGSTEPIMPPIIPPVIPAPSPSPVEPEPVPSVQPPQETVPTPVQPSAPVQVPVPVAPPVEPSIAPVVPAVPLPAVPESAEVQPYVLEPEAPVEPEASTPAEETVSPSTTPSPTEAPAPPVASADIAGPLKVALAPVAENNPLAQGLMVLVLILLGVAYFRALRTKGIRGPRLNGK